jgi:Family of unknown function (DUF5681)
MTGDDEVGFGRPPKRTRWKKGESGNPGRRRARRAATTAEIVEKLLLAPIHIIENGNARRVTVMEAISCQLWKKAAGGNPRAVDVMLKYQELAKQHLEVATEITFGDSAYHRDCGPTPTSEVEHDDGRV